MIQGYREYINGSVTSREDHETYSIVLIVDRSVVYEKDYKNDRL